MRQLSWKIINHCFHAEILAKLGFKISFCNCDAIKQGMLWIGYLKFGKCSKQLARCWILFYFWIFDLMRNSVEVGGLIVIKISFLKVTNIFEAVHCRWIPSEHVASYNFLTCSSIITFWSKLGIWYSMLNFFDWELWS